MRRSAWARNAKAQPAPRQEAQTLSVGILAGLGSSWRIALERLTGHLNSDKSLAAEPACGNDTRRSGDDAVEDYDCLVLLGWPATNDRRRLKQIELYCRGGGSIVAVRTLGASVPGWPDFAEEVFGGRQIESGQSRILEVRRSDIAWHHPALDGLDGPDCRGRGLSRPAAFIFDNHRAYRRRRPRHRAGGMDHATRRQPSPSAPALGHEDDSREPAFLRLISQAVRWTSMGAAVKSYRASRWDFRV